MCFELRKTARRGLSAVPNSRLRTRRCRLNRRVCTRCCWFAMFTGLTPLFGQPAPTSSSLRTECLASLAADEFAFVTDPLALVGLGRAHFAHDGRKLADGLLVGTANCYMRLIGHLNGHTCRCLQDNLIGIPYLERDGVGFFELSLV